jgi:hypothetical protein
MGVHLEAVLAPGASDSLPVNRSAALQSCSTLEMPWPLRLWRAAFRGFKRERGT